MLAANWFIKYRGRVMGIITLGSPLFSVIGTSVMTTFISTRLNGDYRPFYVGICIVLVAIALLVALLLKDAPENAGLYPDGADHPPISESSVDEVHLTVKQVLSQPKAWWLIPSAFAATITVWFINRGLGVQYWVAMLVLVLIGILALVPLLKMKDANAADRG